MTKLTPQQHSGLEVALQSLLKQTNNVVKIPCEFLESVKKFGAHRAIYDFLKPDGAFPKVLIQLHRAGKLPLSIESMVLQPEWREFFDEPLLIEASNRLQEVSSVL